MFFYAKNMYKYKILIFEWFPKRNTKIGTLN